MAFGQLRVPQRPSTWSFVHLHCLWFSRIHHWSDPYWDFLFFAVPTHLYFFKFATAILWYSIMGWNLKVASKFVGIQRYFRLLSAHRKGAASVFHGEISFFLDWTGCFFFITFALHNIIIEIKLKIKNMWFLSSIMQWCEIEDSKPMEGISELLNALSYRVISQQDFNVFSLTS